MPPAARLDFPTTNNTSEYEPLIQGLCKVKTLGARHIIVKSDSCLMAGHFGKSFTPRDPEMATYLAAVRGAAKHFLGIIVQTIPRENNEADDELAKLTSFAQRPPPRRTSSTRYYAHLRLLLKRRGRRSKRRGLHPKHKGLRTGRAPPSSTKSTGGTSSPVTEKA